jgi:protein SCO1/2
VLSACTQHYDGAGVVLKVSPHEVTLSHKPIHGYMEAMAMPFEVRDARITQDLRPGDRVKFKLVVTRSASYIENIDIVSAARSDAGLSRSPAKSTLVPIGASIPEFTLTDQNGERLSLSSLRGKVVLVTFIYTRCPLPDYCPRLMLNFADLQRRFARQLGNELVLLTITFDPRHDTSEVMAHYGASYRANAHGWRLLTGSNDEIQHVTELFGIEFWPDEGLVTHTLQTAIIDRSGHLYATVEGKDYTLKQLVDLVNVVLEHSAG